MDKFKALSPYILTGMLSFAAGGFKRSGREN